MFLPGFVEQLLSVFILFFMFHLKSYIIAVIVKECVCGVPVKPLSSQVMSDPRSGGLWGGGALLP